MEKNKIELFIYGAILGISLFFLGIIISHLDINNIVLITFLITIFIIADIIGVLSTAFLLDEGISSIEKNKLKLFTWINYGLVYISWIMKDTNAFLSEKEGITFSGFFKFHVIIFLILAIIYCSILFNLLKKKEKE